jgi:hypothetical protein
MKACGVPQAEVPARAGSCAAGLSRVLPAQWGKAAADIEPSAVDGYAYADVVREVFGLHPRDPRPNPN